MKTSLYITQVRDRHSNTICRFKLQWFSGNLTVNFNAFNWLFKYTFKKKITYRSPFERRSFSPTRFLFVDFFQFLKVIPCLKRNERAITTSFHRPYQHCSRSLAVFTRLQNMRLSILLHSARCSRQTQFFASFFRHERFQLSR